MSKLPSIAIYTKTNIDIKQNYDNIKTFIVNDFNNIKQTTDILCYLYPDFNFANNNILNSVAKVFMSYPIHGAYGDVIINGNINYMPSFNVNKINKQIIVNSPLISARPLQFNEKLNHLYYLDCLIKTSQNTIWFHVAQPLFTISNIRQQDIQSDLHQIYGLRTT